MDSPHVAELDLSVRVETVVTSIKRVTVVAWPSVQHVRVVGVLGEESLAEFVEIESSVIVCVVAFEEKISLLRCWENPNCCKSISQISH